MLQDGQVVLVRFPHGGSSKSKLRPALVVRRLPGKYDDWLICLISTKLRLEVPGFDQLVHPSDDDFKASGLKTASLIRVSRLATVERKLFVGTVGSIFNSRLSAVKTTLSGWILESPRSA